MSKVRFEGEVAARISLWTARGDLRRALMKVVIDGGGVRVS